MKRYIEVQREVRKRDRGTYAQVKTDYFCPFCGKQDMWQDVGSDDYYTGTRTHCGECGELTDGLPTVEVTERKPWWDREE